MSLQRPSSNMPARQTMFDLMQHISDGVIGSVGIEVGKRVAVLPPDASCHSQAASDLARRGSRYVSFALPSPQCVICDPPSSLFFFLAGSCTKLP